MAIRFMSVGLVSVALMLAATGCWDIQYLDRLGIVMAIGVDKDPTDHYQYKITVQTVLPQNAAGAKGSDGSPVMTLSETGDTLFEAIRKMSGKTSRRLFFSHTQLLLISEEVAQEGITPTMDIIERNSNIRSDISVMIAKGLPAEQLLKIRTQMESIPANQMKDTVEISQKIQGLTYDVQVRDIARISESEGMQIAVPVIGVEGNPEAGNSKDSVNVINTKVKPELKTMAVFHDGKLSGYLTPEESRGLAWMRNKISSTAVKQNCERDRGHYIIEVIDSDAKVKVQETSERLPVIAVEVRLKASIHEIVCPDMAVRDEKALKEIEQKLNATVEEEMNSAIRKLQRGLRTDALGWGVDIYHQHPKKWKELSESWIEEFPRISSRVICISQITSTGVRSDPIRQ